MGEKVFIVFVICIMNTQVASEAIGKRSFQRRFLWKQMDDTVDDLMIGVMSGARVMRGMLGGAKTRNNDSPFAYVPSETTRVKYIIRSPMKTIKFRSPKKPIHLATVPKPFIEGKFFKPQIIFPSTTDLLKLEKEQELKVEGRKPARSSEEVVAETESERSINNENEKDKSMKSGEKLDIERKSEKNATDVFRSHLQGAPSYEEWLPIQQQYPTSPKAQGLLSTSKSHSVGKLHTNIVDSLQPEPVKIYTRSPVAIGTLHTNIIDSSPRVPARETHDRNSHIIANKDTSYQGSEHVAQESEAIPNYNHSTKPSIFENDQAAFSTKLKKAVSTTNRPTSTSSTEEPNYPKEFLRKYRENVRTAGERLESNTISTVKKDTNSTLPKSIFHNGINKWLPEIVASNSAAVKSSKPVILPKGKSLSEAVPTRRKKESIITTKSNENAETVPPSHHDLRQRGNIRFRSTISADEVF